MNTTLADRILEAREAYYNGEPVMSDAEFDALEDELRALDPHHPLFSQVGAFPQPKSGWAKAQHTQPMGSLSKAQDAADFARWAGQVQGPYLVMDKMDGASISLRFDKGQFIQAITRGNGLLGEDITANAKRMAFPKKVPGFTGFIRGEVMCTLSAFAKFAGAANPRNTANGAMKRHDGAGCENLTVFAFEVAGASGSKFEELRFLRSLGFKTPEFSSAASLVEVQAIYDEYVAGRRSRLDYEIDGLVVSVLDNAARNALGASDGRPKGAIAYKFPHEQATTTLRKVSWGTGVTGRVAPVAEFDFVSLAGVQVGRASLHNASYIARLGGLRVGDSILVSRRNDVIPAVEALIRDHGGAEFHPPTNCPSCDSVLTREGEYIVCRSQDCPAQFIGGVGRWIGDMGVLHFGTALVQALIDNGLVTGIPSLYRLNVEDVANATFADGSRVGTAIATRALGNLRNAMSVELDAFIGGLGLPLFGSSMTRMMIEAGYDTLEKLRGASLAQIEAVPGVGSVKAQTLFNGLREKSALIDEILAEGVKINPPKVKSVGFLTGKSMCMTGFRDAKLQGDFEAAGGEIKSGVSKGLTYLVAKDANSGSSKLQKARELGVIVLSPAEMSALIAKGC